MVSATKDPIKVRAGKIGADTRWGPEPRVIRLDELTPPQRRLVVALVDAARKEAAPVSETSGTAESEVRGGATPTS
ncbi:MAG TPA: hypothetical protein VIM30_09670 [Candidatus Limnocylindrales bacterium]